MIAAQSAVDVAVARASPPARRCSPGLVGSAVGVAVFGALVNAGVTDRLGHATPDLEHLDPSILEPAIHTVFVGSAIVAVALVVVSLLMPRRIEHLED